MDELKELRDRLDTAQWLLERLATETLASAFERKARLAGKVEGVKLALSYVDEMLRTAAQ
jgi:hypothetical protein